MDKDFSDNPLRALLGNAQKIKEQIEHTQKHLEKIEVRGCAGGNLVQIVVNGNRKTLSIIIDDTVMNDKAMLQDLLIVAANDATAKLEQAIKENISQSVPDMFRTMM